MKSICISIRCSFVEVRVIRVVVACGLRRRSTPWVQPQDPGDQDVHQETVLCFLYYSLLFKHKKTLVICLFCKYEIFITPPGQLESNPVTPETKMSIMRLCSAFYTILFIKALFRKCLFRKWEIFIPLPGQLESNPMTPETKMSIGKLCSAFYTIIYYSSTRWEIFTPSQDTSSPTPRCPSGDCALLFVLFFYAVLYSSSTE